MRKLLPLGVALFILTTACQKEISYSRANGTGTSDGSELGNWKFISMAVSTKGTVDLSDGSDVLTSVTFAHYESANETGTISFNGSEAVSTDIGYSTHIFSNTYFYTNAVLDDSLASDFSIDIPPSGGVTPYQKIGTDSIYFPSGSVVSVQTGSSNPVDGSGYKLSWNGDTMYMRTHIRAQYETDNQGLSQKTDEEAEALVKLLKQ